jgi:peptide-methionine (R)-S-oxide reductase
MPRRRSALWLAAALVAGGLGVAAAVNSGGVRERVGIPMNGRLEKSDTEWRQALSEEAYAVTRRKGTERAFTGAYWDSKEDGVYQCVCCGQPLFDASSKFDSGTGWPSFWQPVDENALTLKEDRGLFTRRTEVLCSRCDAHLGHVFPDGPPPTGQRYCLNSVALKRVPREAPKPEGGEGAR